VQGQLYALPLVILGDGWDVTVQKIAGTDRSIRFSVRQDTNDVNTATITAGAIAAATFAANAIDANALAASAATEIQTGLATSAALALVQVDTDDIQARLPAALDGSGNIKAGVQTMAAGAITAIAAGVLAVVVEGAITVQGALRLIMSSTVFNVSGFLANAPNYRDAADTKNRIVATTTTDGRTTVTVDPA
jgi:hypothetical protein